MANKIWILTTLCFLVPLGRAQDFTERAKIQGLTTASDAWFGLDVATDGRRTVVGSPYATVSAPGRAHVFQGCGTIAETQELVPSDGFAGDGFGFEVAIEGDRIVVGAPQYTVGPGAAYVFRFDGVQWIQEQKLTAFDGAVGDAFGRSVDLQGDLIVVGAPEKATRDGAVYYYRFDGAQWTFEHKSLHFIPGIDPRYGSAVTIDGDLVAISMIHFGWASGEPNWGAVLTQRHGGGTWSDESLLLNPGPPIPNEYFGAAVALQGDRMLVTAPGFDGAVPNSDVGAIYAYQLINGTWTLQQTLVPSGAAPGDAVGGWSIAMDGDTAAVAAWEHDGAAVDAGGVFVYHHDGTQWVEDPTVTTSDAQAGDRLYSVDLQDGLLVAGVFQDDDRGVDSGSLYVFVRSFGPYGSGLAGSGGLTPGLSAVGTATPGGALTMEFRDFVGGAMSRYIVSLAPAATPLLDGLILVNLGRRVARTCFVAPGAAGAAGEGDIDFQISVPADPTFQCLDVYVQGLAFDTGASRNVSMTNGLHILID